MRNWIKIVEEGFSSELLAKVSPYTKQGQKFAKEIEDAKKQIASDEQDSITHIPPNMQYATNSDEQAWRAELELITAKQKEKEQEELRATAIQKQRDREKQRKTKQRCGKRTTKKN